MSQRPRFDPARMAARRDPAPSMTGLFAAPGGGSPPGVSSNAPPDEGRSPPDDRPPAGGHADPAAEGPRRLTVSQLAAIIDRALRDQLPQRVRVVGEVSQFRERTHWYFDLKDSESLISCVMFAGAARKSGFTPTIGQEVVVSGRVEFYAKQGRTTFMADKIEPIGEGALEIAFRKLCDELRDLGWFDEDRKRPLPVFPRRIAVVTSATGAALQDVLDTLRRRSPMVEVATVDVRVQGDSAASEVAAALRALSRRHAELAIDAVLITRGGGSREDLWAFNDRDLARAIVECRVPVVAAIGHETDTTIAELVADLRCATPTQAAVRIAPDAAALHRQLDALDARLRSGVVRSGQLASGAIRERQLRLVSTIRHRLATDADRLARAGARLERHRPVAVYAEREQSLRRASSLLFAAMAGAFRRHDLDSLDRRLRQAMDRSVLRAERELADVDRALELVGPAGVLRRGYSVTLGPDGRAIRSVGDVAPGDRLTTRVADGQLASEVLGDAASETRPMTMPPPRERTQRPRRREADPGPGLFGS